MTNSAQEGNIKEQSAADKHANIETVTPDTENVLPLSRQDVAKEKNATEDEHEPQVEERIDAKEETLEPGEENKNNDPGADIETVSP
jgi:hypothetical protein